MTRSVAFSGLAMLAAGMWLREPAEPHKPRLLRVAVLQDLSQSAGPNGIATIQTSELSDLVNAVTERGGEVVFGLIARQDEPLVRLRIAPRVGVNAYQRNAARQAVRRETSRFLQLAQTRLRSEPSPVTDLTSALQRVNRFFQEPASRNARQVLILVSDCLHDASPVRPPDVVEGVEVLVAAGGKRPLVRGASYFEGIGAAIAHVTQGDSLP